MSQENVDLVREVWKAYGDRGVDAISGYYARDARVEDFPELPDGSTYVGPDGARERYWHFVRTWGDFSIEPVEYIDAGDNAVIVVTAMSGAGSGSGVPLDGLAVFVFEIRHGKIVRDRAFMSKQAALKAVGLTE